MESAARQHLSSIPQSERARSWLNKVRTVPPSQTLHARFDLNNDGTLDMQEWMLARQAAKREAENRISAARAEPDTSFLVQPHDQRLFLISNLKQDRLERRYWLWAWAHLVILFGALGGIAWWLRQPLF